MSLFKNQNTFNSQNCDSNRICIHYRPNNIWPLWKYSSAKMSNLKHNLFRGAISLYIVIRFSDFTIDYFCTYEILPSSGWSHTYSKFLSKMKTFTANLLYIEQCLALICSNFASSSFVKCQRILNKS